MSENSGLKEELMSLNTFIQMFLLPSTTKNIWPLNTNESDIAYLAQHQLFEQIPSLLKDIDACPSLCGDNGPSHINAWIGTGGTRTPCHYDTYDNILVQIVGVKYVRLYHPSQTRKLYVLKQSDINYGKQGNMSAIDCEREDYSTHPMAAHAEYSETVLFPGDCIYIPLRHWHYVRSLSTSASVNYWF